MIGPKIHTHNLVKNPELAVPDILVHHPLGAKSRAKLDLADLHSDGSHPPRRWDGLILGVFEPKTHVVCLDHRVRVCCWKVQVEAGLLLMRKAEDNRRELNSRQRGTLRADKNPTASGRWGCDTAILAMPAI